MKFETNNAQLEDFYSLCNLCDDDIEFIALFIQYMRIRKPLVKIKNDLELYKFKKYENEIALILDTLSIQTIKNLYKLHTNLYNEQIVLGQSNIDNIEFYAKLNYYFFMIFYMEL